MLQLHKPTDRRQDAAELLNQRVVPIASARAGDALTTVDMVATATVFPAAAPATKKQAATARAAQRNPEALAELYLHNIIG